MEQKSYHHGDLKAQLMREGLRILNSEGYEGLTMRKVAKACGVSQTAPYRHFKDKDALVFAITVQALDAFNASLEEAIAGCPADDPKMQLKQMGVAYVRFFAEHPEYLWLLFLSSMQKDAAQWCAQQDFGKRPHPFVTFHEVVKRYMAAFPDEEKGLNGMTLYCWGFVHGVSVLIASGQIPFDEDALALTERIIMSPRFF